MRLGRGKVWLYRCSLIGAGLVGACAQSAGWQGCRQARTPEPQPHAVQLHSNTAARRHLEIEPGHVASRFWLAALSGDAADAAACPPEMVAGLFDQYAEKFDEHLVGVLQYKTPELLRCAVRLPARGGGESTHTASTEAVCFRPGWDAAEESGPRLH